MREQKKERRIGRRDLLKLAGVGGLAGAAAVAGTKREASAAAEQAPRGGGYRETDHVKTYYRSARF